MTPYILYIIIVLLYVLVLPREFQMTIIDVFNQYTWNIRE